MAMRQVLTKLRRTERLSALADGELDPAPPATSCAAWARDAELRADWHAWHLIGDVLRSEDLASEPRARSRFLRRVARATRAEPVVLAPAPRAPTGGSGARAGARRPLDAAVGGRGRLRPGGRHLRRRSPPAARSDRADRPGRRAAPAAASPARRSGASDAAPRRRSRSSPTARSSATPSSNATSQPTSSSPAPRRSACRRHSCAARPSIPRRAEPRPSPMLLPRRRPLLTFAWAGLAHAAPACSADRRRGLADRAERDAGLAAAHPRRRQPAQLPGHFRRQRRRRTSPARASPTSAKGRTSTSGSSRSTAGSAAVYRHNDVVHTLWPANHVAMIEQRGMLSSFPALLQAGDDGIADWYEVRAEGGERVAGHEAERARQSRPRRSPLRLPALGRPRFRPAAARRGGRRARRRPRDRLRFPTSSIGIRPQPESVLNAMSRLDGYRVVRPVLTPTRLEDGGLGDAPAGAGLSPGELRQPADRGCRATLPASRRGAGASRASIPTA